MTEQRTRLSIFLGESDHMHGKPVYHLLTLKARQMGLAGATVLRGLEGYGHHSRIHTANLLELSTDLPMVFIAMDHEEKILQFLKEAQQIVPDGLASLETVTLYPLGSTKL